jgi:hypothetical protein
MMNERGKLLISLTWNYDVDTTSARPVFGSAATDAPGGAESGGEHGGKVDFSDPATAFNLTTDPTDVTGMTSVPIVLTPGAPLLFDLPLPDMDEAPPDEADGSSEAGNRKRNILFSVSFSGDEHAMAIDIATRLCRETGQPVTESAVVREKAVGWMQKFVVGEAAVQGLCETRLRGRPLGKGRDSSGSSRTRMSVYLSNGEERLVARAAERMTRLTGRPYRKSGMLRMAFLEAVLGAGFGNS